MKNIMQTLGKSKLARNLVFAGSVLAGSSGCGEFNFQESVQKTGEFREFHGQAYLDTITGEKYLRLIDEGAVLVARSDKEGGWHMMRDVMGPLGPDWDKLKQYYDSEDSLDLAYNTLYGKE